MIRHLIVLLISLAAFLPALASDSDLQQQLGDTCKNTTFVLRQPDASKDIEFDSQGNRLGTPKPGYWFENAAFQCSIVNVTNGDVTFEGMRFVLEFDVLQKDFVPKPLYRKVRVTIKAPADSAQVSTVLKKILMTKEEIVRDAAPDYWQRFFHPELRVALAGPDNKTEKNQPKQENASDQTLYKVGGSISAPKAIYDPAPDYPQLARKEKKQGLSVLWVIIDEKGRPTAITVTRPAGHGFDDMAAEIVKDWEFKPAMKGKTPVRVQVNIEVNFAL